MSNIYIQEPPTSGKVLLSTTVGDIDIELWSKETPKACRNFVQLCMENYYDGLVFHRLVKGFIVQGGDPTATGTGGESIYGRPFRDEFHSRLRFVRRGLVAMANAGKDDNGSQFFFTLGATPELQNKHTVFGKVTGNTLYNMLKLEESVTDSNERPLYPHKIISTKILSNPFPDIIPRVIKKEDKVEKEKKPAVAKGTKNFKLLSFGEEAEEEEAEVDIVAKGFRGKSKSSHDLTNDPKLSSVPAVELPEDEQPSSKRAQQSEEDQQEALDRIRKKLRRDSPPNVQGKARHKAPDTSDAKTEVKEEHIETTKEDEREKVRQEIKNLKKAIRGDTQKSNKKSEDGKDENDENKADMENSMLTEFYNQSKIFQDKKKTQLKGSQREEQTLALLAKFQTKMQTAREKLESEDDAKGDPPPSKDEDDELDDENDETWLTHTLKFEDKGLVIAKDANVKATDRYEISDPRNPINERKRESSKHSMKGKKH